MQSGRLVVCLTVSFSLLLGAKGIADEGMWLYTHPPKQVLKEKYNFEPTPEWLEHLQKSSVRFLGIASGSIVSPDGLVMTNHHVGSDSLQKLSTKDRDLLKKGYVAHNRGEELKCHDLELNVLQTIEDVTARVNDAVKPEMSAAEAEKARRAIRNTIEKESLDKTGLKSEVVTLYHGGQYHLYRYKKYSDIRLVFAPEAAIAFFGGDPDNFEYPRFDLDVCFFRIYENDKPAKIEHYLKWSKNGAANGDLIFVSGHPGRTDRLFTVKQLEYQRDVAIPLSIQVLCRREVYLAAFGARSLENDRQAQEDLFGIRNARKVRLGQIDALQSTSLISQKRKAEEALQEAVRKDKTLAEKYGSAWDNVSKAVDAWRPIHVDQYLLERGIAFNSELFEVARTIVRLVEESKKPNTERLREYGDANLDSLKQKLFSEAPIYPDLEVVKLTESLSLWTALVGAENDVVRKALAGQAPSQRANELVRNSELAKVSVRKNLAEMSADELGKASDPMIQLARLVDGPARKVRAEYEQQVEEPLRQAFSKLAGARFATQGTTAYPDATFTLRLAFGTVKGYKEAGELPPFTTIGGAFLHSDNHQHREPFELPKSWLDRKEKLNRDTPFNFVCTADIIGGNSGSPVVNRNNEVVGLIFDGNIQSLVLDYLYEDQIARAIAVDSRAIIEALRNVYDAKEVVSELMKAAGGQ